MGLTPCLSTRKTGATYIPCVRNLQPSSSLVALHMIVPLCEALRNEHRTRGVRVVKIFNFRDDVVRCGTVDRLLSLARKIMAFTILDCKQVDE